MEGSHRQPAVAGFGYRVAAVLFDLGLPSKVGRLMFIIGRVAGLSAEVLEEHTREKPMRIKIPVAYDGVPPRKNGQRS